MSGPNSAAAPTRRESGLVVALRSLILLLVLGTVQGTYIATFHRDDIAQRFPGATPVVFAAMLVATAIGLVAALGLWAWRRWALWLWAASGVAIVALDLVARAPAAHTALAAISTGIILLLALALKDRFQAPRA